MRGKSFVSSIINGTRRAVGGSFANLQGVQPASLLQQSTFLTKLRSLSTSTSGPALDTTQESTLTTPKQPTKSVIAQIIKESETESPDHSDRIVALQILSRMGGVHNFSMQNSTNPNEISEDGLLHNGFSKTLTIPKSKKNQIIIGDHCDNETKLCNHAIKFIPKGDITIYRTSDKKNPKTVISFDGKCLDLPADFVFFAGNKKTSLTYGISPESSRTIKTLEGNEQLNKFQGFQIFHG